ncbi:hypothetical protein IC620_07635 [Hazenella sp. IB182357]|uniref:Non-canonical purine NTP pyrophosphatase n=1 Tax=Polycladospora coralii TaxID=2771432 RepID=A0A926NET7_9BACL|nr:non-canonical purine NTP pyrophosphatase [Polycladospora coralii]MBD1372234.1 hypothetical protein [Polycladospora coralii]MBS7530733.1 hypothetical protein [Polycladospora coralii]
MKILFATQNRGKLEEANNILNPLGYEVREVPFSFSEPATGSVKKIAHIKLQQIINEGFDCVMVDDAGIFFEAYPTFPGVLSKRLFQQLGYKGMAKLLDGESRSAWFEGCIALSWQGKIQTFSGKTHGSIIHFEQSPTENPHFPYDPIFIPNGENRTLSEMSTDERLSYSYRREALLQLANWLEERAHACDNRPRSRK